MPDSDEFLPWNLEAFDKWSQHRKAVENLKNSRKIPLEGFYSFYVVPWNPGQYVKFPTPHLLLGPNPKAEPVFAAPHDYEIDSWSKIYSMFLKGYLGTSRLDDETRMKKITEHRTELELASTSH